MPIRLSIQVLAMTSLAPLQAWVVAHWYAVLIGLVVVAGGLLVRSAVLLACSSHRPRPWKW